MTKSKFSLFIIGVLAISFSFSSCTKDTAETLNDNLTTATDYTALLGILDLNDLDDATLDATLKSASEIAFGPCFEVTIHENENNEFWPRSWTFSYTDEECVDCFGNTKSGSVNVVLTDFWKNEGSSRTVTFVDFSINGDKLEGTRNILNTGFNDLENLTFERSFLDASYSRADTASMTWESFRDVEMIAGYESFLAVDDEYMVSGSASGINFSGNSFTATITDELYYKKCSMFPVSGSITIEIEGESSIYINYGEGECDNLADMTIDDVTTEITLGSRD
jgi:hypothetical protein